MSTAQRSAKPQAALLQIQELDLQSAELQTSLEQTPHKDHILALRSKLREGKRRLEKLNKALAGYDLRITGLQTELDEVLGRIKTEQKKIEASADYREVDALTHELEALAKRKEAFEFKQLEHMEKRQSFARAVQDTQAKMDQLRTLEARQCAAYAEFKAKISSALSDIASRRAQTAAAIAPEDLLRYERIRDEKGGVGVALFRSGTCEACSVAAPVALRTEIEDSETFGQCPTCGRLLIAADESASDKN
jgi:predicted  nucleic acid-binding Zn-ribbon protein